MQTLGLYTRFLNQGLNVTAFDNMKTTIFPKIEVEPTFFVVTLDGVELGTFSAYQIQQAFQDETGHLEFDQDFTL